MDDSKYKDFFWEYTEEPHASRRKVILAKHPEIKTLMKAKGDRKVAVIGLVLAVLQVCIGIYCCGVSMPWKFAINILIGSWISSWHFLVLHESVHNLVFGPSHPRLNQAYGLFINLFCGVPTFSFYKKLHKDHHKFQGDEFLDIEYPVDFEKDLFNGSPTSKLFWLQNNGILMHIRAFFVGPRKPYLLEEKINQISVLTVNILLIYCGYPWVFTHFLLAFFAAMGIGLIGTWGQMVHTVFFPPHEDTVSYYGWLNPYYLNFGYHQEHHDFPNVPGRLLPQLHNMAPEFYQDFHRFDSLLLPMLKFVHDDRIGLQSRLKRRREKSNLKVDEVAK